MAGQRDSLGGAGTKRKQIVEEYGTPVSQKRLKQDSSRPQKISPKGIENTGVESMSETPGTPFTRSSKKGKRRGSAVAADAPTPVPAGTGSTPAVSNAQDDDLLSRKERKRLRRAAERAEKGTDQASDASKRQKTQPMDLKLDNNATDATAAALQGATTQSAGNRAANKEARRSAQLGSKAKATAEVVVGDISAEPLAISTQAAVVTPVTSTAKKSKPSGATSKTSQVKEEPAQDGDALQTTRSTGLDRKLHWELSAASAGRYIFHDPIFVTNSLGEDFLLAATMGQVQVLSLDSSLPVVTFDAPPRVSILAIGQAPGSAEVEIVDDSGTLTSWNWEADTTDVFKVPQKAPVTSYAVSVSVEGDGTERIDRVFASSGLVMSTLFINEKAAYKTRRGLSSVHLLAGGQYIVAHHPEAVVLGRRKKGSDSFDDMTWVELPMSTPITCAHAALRQDGKSITLPGLHLALGCDNGQIHLYEDVSPLFDLKEAGKLPSPRVLHWHRDAVSSVKFSMDNNYLVSGGKETVMVLWQLDTGKKQFLPHLTSEIQRIVVSPRGDRYAVQMGDNSIMVLSTSELKPVANFAGLQMPAQRSKHEEQLVLGAPTPAILHSQYPDHLLITVPATQPKSSKDIVTRPFLQTFDLRSSRHISRQALTRNNVTDFNLSPEGTPITPPDVADLAISADGQWLATIDDWFPGAKDMAHLASDPTSEGEQQLRKREVYLKFWQWDAAQSLWTLTTRIDAPHARAHTGQPGAGEVLQLTADPSGKGFATVGEDSCIKLWKPKTRMRHGVPLNDEQGNPLIEWTCRRTIGLERQVARVDSPMLSLTNPVDEEAFIEPSRGSIAFSEDGSLLAASVSFDFVEPPPVTHIIDTATGETKISRDDMADIEPTGLGFIERHLIALSNCKLRVFDLVKDELVYEVEMPDDLVNEQDSALLAVNAKEKCFAVVVPGVRGRKQTVSIYGTVSGTPLYGEKVEVPITAILSGKGTRGFVLLCADATVRKLATSVKGQGPATKKLDLSMTEDPVDVAAGAAAPALLPPTTGGAKATLLLESVEDDRPVVRPEQLAGVFDVGMGAALPSVRDMFRAVAGLYGRKPRVANAVGSGDAVMADV